MAYGGSADSPRVDGAFLLRLVVAFVVGGLAVALFTAAAERHGSRLGGLLLSFPVKVVASLLLIGWSEGATFAASTAAAVPAGIAINVVFLGSAALLALRWPARRALAAGLSLWFVAGVLVLVARPPGGVATLLLLWAAAALAALWLLDRVPGARGDRRSSRGSDGFGARGLAARALGAGSVVAASVLLARIVGPFAGGLMSVFPSGFLTSLYILLSRHGPQFTAATARVMVAGSAAPALFGASASLLVARVGLLSGLGLALALATLTSMGIGWALAQYDGAAAPSPS